MLSWDPVKTPVGLPSTSFLDGKATAGSQGPRSRQRRRMEQEGPAGEGCAAKARRAPYKCRVCFQRSTAWASWTPDTSWPTVPPRPPPATCAEPGQLPRDGLGAPAGEACRVHGLWACGMCLREVVDVGCTTSTCGNTPCACPQQGRRGCVGGTVPTPGGGGVAHALPVSGIVAGVQTRQWRAPSPAGQAGCAEASGPDAGAGKAFPRSG